MDGFSRDWAAYASGKYAAGREGEVMAADLNDRAVAALLAFLSSRGLSLRQTPQEIVRPIADSFCDGFLDEIVRLWGAEAQEYQAPLPIARECS